MTPNQLQRGNEINARITELEEVLDRVSQGSNSRRIGGGEIFSERTRAQVSSIQTVDLTEQLAQLREEFNAL